MSASIRLSRALYQSGMTRYGLAHISGLTLEQVAQYLDGGKDLADDGHSGLFASILNVSPRWLLTGDPSAAGRDAVASFRRLPEFKTLSDHDREAIIALLESFPAGDELEDPPRDPSTINSAQVDMLSRHGIPHTT